MNKEMIEWSKVFLMTHPLTQALLAALDRSIDKSAELGYGSRHFSSGQSAYAFVDGMLAMGLRKKRIAAMYNVVEDILSGMGVQANILRHKFINRKRIEDFPAEESVRTKFRRYDRALSSFAAELIRKGYDDKELNSLFSADNVIMRFKQLAGGRQYA